jgi:hypothetical protein
MYNCDLCLKTFTTKQHLHKHCDRIKPCNLKTNFTCNWCNKSFLYPSNKTRHENESCPSKKEHDKLEKEKEKSRLLELKIVELETMNKAGINPITSKNDINNKGDCNAITNIAGNHNITNITINKFGCEDLSHITHKEMVAIFRRCYGSVPAFIMLKHFNKSAPQNKNVYIADLKSRYALTYDGTRWNIIDRNQLLDEMYDENCYYLKGQYEEKYDQLDDETATTFRKFLDSKNETEIEEMVKENIRQMLFNERTRK